MKIKLQPYLCYLAGLQSRSRTEQNAIGIFTHDDVFESKFVKMCLDKVKIEPNRIIIEEGAGGTRHIFFYHSKLGSQLRKISENCGKMFRAPTNESRSYLAGIFDAAGHLTVSGLYISKISVQESIMLQQLGVHTQGEKVLNISQFLKLIDGFSFRPHALPKSR